MPNFATFCFQYPVRESAAARRTTACCLHPLYARRQHLLPHLQIESLLSLPLDQRGVLYYVVRAPGAQSGPGGARILVCGSSDRRYTVSATSPNSFRIGLFDRQEPKKKARRRYDTGPCGSSKSRPSVINAYFHWRAHSRADHSPLGQMICGTAGPSAISV